MGNSLRLFGITAVLALGLAACSTDDGGSGTGGMAGAGATGGNAGTGGMAATGGTGGDAGTGGTAGADGRVGAGGSSEFCIHDGICNDDDDCVCADCDSDFFCGNPQNGVDDGDCRSWQEGCVCDDCKTHPECWNF